VSYIALPGSEAVEREQNAFLCGLDLDDLVGEGWTLFIGPVRNRGFRGGFIANPTDADARSILDKLELIEPHRQYYLFFVYGECGNDGRAARLNPVCGRLLRRSPLQHPV
jgi:hypothetical protein